MNNTTFSTVDASSPAIRSPLSLTTDISELVAPLNASRMVLLPTDAIDVSEDSEMDSYATLIAGSPHEMNVTPNGSIYVRVSSGSGSLSFMFMVA